MVYEVILGEKHYGIEIDDSRVRIAESDGASVAGPDKSSNDDLPDFVFEDQSEEELILSPMQGKIIAIKLNKNQSVKRGDTVAVLESMKMEINVTSPTDGIIERVLKNAGDFVKNQDVIMQLKYV